MGHKTVQVPNISCGHCVKTIEREVGEVPGVRSVSANQERREVSVEWDEGATSWHDIEALLEEINYPPATA
ncbi:MAG: heavy-metal-associated domain-containing protein [Gemmatimonadota bacterium]|jgi:copper ion binding protein